jgi:hypothetical protein
MIPPKRVQIVQRRNSHVRVLKYRQKVGNVVSPLESILNAPSDCLLALRSADDCIRPLHIAVELGNVELVEYLLQYSVDVNASKQVWHHLST